MRISWILILLALPSLFGSVLLMRLAGAALSLQIQQVAVALLGIVAVVWIEKGRRQHDAMPSTNAAQETRFSLVALALLLIGLAACFAFSETGNPSRWLKLGVLRLYFSAAALPAAIYLLARLHWRLRFSTLGSVALFSLFAVILAAQPDLSQVLALTLAALFIVWHRADSLTLKIGGSVVWGLLCYCCWLQADPLQPVAYVEGVIQLAASANISAMFAAIIAVALLPLGLFFIALKRGMPELMPVALYYLVIMVYAYRGLTPMPLLGFGAGPVLGYFAVLALRRKT